MEQFGLWNLLKSILSAGQEAPSNSPSAAVSPPKTHAQPPSNPPPKAKENACERYLLRHENLRQKRK